MHRCDDMRLTFFVTSVCKYGNYRGLSIVLSVDTGFRRYFRNSVGIDKDQVSLTGDDDISWNAGPYSCVPTWQGICRLKH